MITLITGVPGSGKTLNAIRLVRDLALKDNRQVYYNHIDELAPSLGWLELSNDQVLKWFELPVGSIVLVDESHNIFRMRPVGSAMPESVLKMTEHRHFGIDIFLLTQHSKLIDFDVRKLVGRHIDITCPTGKGASVLSEWEGVQESVKDYHSLQKAKRSVITHDRSIYKLYKSAEIHTAKWNIPYRTLLFVAIAIAAVLWGAFRVTGNISKTSAAVKQSSVLGMTTAGLQSSGALNTPSSSSVPRVIGMPWTAPKYDLLNVPKSRPFPTACLSTATRCSCYTNQDTRIFVDDSFCRDAVKYGLFDDTKTPQTNNTKQDDDTNKPPPEPVTSIVTAPTPAGNLNQ